MPDIEPDKLAGLLLIQQLISFFCLLQFELVRKHAVDVNLPVRDKAGTVSLAVL